MNDPINKRTPLPGRPLYQMLYDGKQTRILMDYLLRLKASSEDNTAMSVDDPKLQLIINDLVDRINDLRESKTAGEPGPKGEPFRYEDFTKEQLNGLIGPSGLQGLPGTPGEAITLSLGSVIGGETAAASIINSGASYFINLTLPMGEQGIPGTPGENGRDIEFKVDGTILQMKYSTDTEWMPLLTIPQPELVFSPHRWPVDQEIDFGDESFGRRFVGIIEEGMEISNQTKLIDLPEASIIMYGGNFKIDETGRCKTPVPTIRGIEETGIYSSIYMDQSGSIWFDSRSPHTRKDSSYDVWIRYIKE